ncbi:lysophospholipid acyltransferase family protein [Rubrobacter aplysinae]|uniref:lysophospholipid acyltransferase family protein n=1 Tax=Rubrobacter aplysinae TaxID=909625 RepID=UPI000A03850D|nr:lysophospholipid acyltransferase family protein [Rubrobacter aplysinae]
MSAPEAPQKVSIGISRRYGLFRRVVVAVAGLLLGLRVHGEEHVPRTGPLIIASNHRRYLDPVYVCMAVPRRIQWMGKKELFVFPFAGLFYLIGSFPVDRQGGGRAALRAALRYLDLGAALGIFPEGTRRRETRTDREAPKSGAIMLASRSGAPVLPVYVGPVPNLLQRLRGERLEIHLGEPRVIREGGRRSYAAAAESLISDIYDLPKAPSGGAV